MRAGDIERMKAVERPHGTRARYVAEKCRCDACRAANTAYYHQRQARAKARVAEELQPVEAFPVPQEWTAPDGTKQTRMYSRACPGVNGKPCPTSSHLRKDSAVCCHRCRMALDWNGLVDAGPVRAHLAALSAQGVGFKAVADAASVARSLCAEIVAGRKTQLRAASAKKILAVDAGARADGSTVPAAETWRRIRWLVKQGWTESEISERIGNNGRALQIGEQRVRASTELAIAQLAREYQREVAAWEGSVEYPHAERIVFLKRRGERTLEQMAAEYPHVWPGATTPRSVGWKQLLCDYRNRSSNRGRPPKL